jgi:hypothetical protein
MTLKVYTKQDDVPEALRSEYKQQGSQWVPDLSDDHPALVFGKTVKQEKEVEEAKVKKLRQDLDDALEAAKTSGVPRGQMLVAKADAELLDKYKPLGTPDELATLKTEHGTLKESETKRTREDKLVTVARELGFDNVEAFKRLPGLPDFDVRDKDGKKSVFALIKDGDRVTEKPALEFLESSPDHSPFLSALKTTGGVKVHGTSSTSTPRPGDPFAWAKEFAENYSKQNSPTTDLATAFNSVGKPAA